MQSDTHFWQNEPKVPPPGGATLRLRPLRDTTLIAGFGRTNPKEDLFARPYQTAQPPPPRASCIAHEPAQRIPPTMGIGQQSDRMLAIEPHLQPVPRSGRSPGSSAS